MIQRLFAIVVTAIATTTTLDALVANETLPSVNLEPYIRDAILYPPSAKYESAALSKVIPGVCYSPFHNKEYPLNGGSAWGLDRAMDEDFSIMKNYVSVVRTYYSSFYGYPVAPWAAKHGIKLHLGVFMTNEAWYANQVNDAVNAVKQYPDTITAILVGNENITPVGPYTPQDVANRVKEIRARVLAETGRQIPVGTVQRAAEWLDGSRRNAMSALAADCDLVGVNIYPFFDANYDANMPLVILNAIWGWLSDWYPPNKLRLTEIGFPTAGGAPSWAPRNIPSLSAAQNFYNAFVNWNPAQGGGDAFWFMFFDRSPNDNTMLVELEKYFGFFTYDKKSKGADFPARLSALNVAVPPTPTPAPPPATSAPTPAPVVTTTAPAVTSAPITKSPWTAASANVCRVRKIYFS